MAAKKIELHLPKLSNANAKIADSSNKQLTNTTN